MREDAASSAASAASRVAARHGYVVEHPVVLQETNHTVVWLRPHAIVAKVGTRSNSAEFLLRERDVAAVLAADGAPVAPPVMGAAAARDDETGFTVTLWQRLDDDPGRPVTPGEVGGALRRLHEGLTRYAGDLPSFRLGLTLARTALADDGAMAALPRGDRSMLRTAFDRLATELDERSFAEMPLHGEPHSGNLLATPDGLRWIDLEAVCVGPLEWDLAFLPEEALELFPEADPALLGLLRTLNSARVATWCWLRAEFPEMRKHGEHHLEQVRRAERSAGRDG